MNDLETLTLAGRPIGPHHPPYIIAELSGNHNGHLDRALALIKAAALAGADAIKLQTYTADTMTLDHDDPTFRVKGGLWDGYTLYELYREAHTPWSWHPTLFAAGREHGITIFSSPFDATAVDLLESLETPVYKIASFELVDLPLIQACAATGKPMILSTGMATLEEIGEALTTAKEAGCQALILLQCISAYPTPVEKANLANIQELARRFGVRVGLSDHTLGTTVAIAATALGACVIEKHLCLDRSEGGVDSDFSLEPEELAQLVTATRAAHAALGTPHFGVKEAENPNRIFRRSLYVVADVAKGQRLTSETIRAIRPGYGLPPKHLETVLTSRASRDLKRGEPLDFSMIDQVEGPSRKG